MHEPKRLTNKPFNKKEMVLLKGGKFLMGSEDPEAFVEDKEGPVRTEEVPPFYMDECAVTNNQFNAFVDETGYKTDAEKYGWSFVFFQFVSKQVSDNEKKYLPQTPWWLGVIGADWQKPEGRGSSITNRMDHPVVHVSWNDAMAYCEWSGKRLPSEKEWEYAARGGLVQKKYPWGDELTPNGVHYCNIWQGEFPKLNTREDGYAGTAPSKSFPPNAYGLYNMSGNVWEWSSDWFGSDKSTKALRGGSYLCHKSYCNRYRIAARVPNTPDTSSGNIGFRCVGNHN